MIGWWLSYPIAKNHLKLNKVSGYNIPEKTSASLNIMPNYRTNSYGSPYFRFIAKRNSNLTA